MYRKLRRRDGSSPLGLDSLMDILSCLVGLMLFIVMYTVMQLGTAAYQAEVLVSREPTPGSRRVVVLCEGGTVRVLDVAPQLRELLTGYEIVQSVDEIERFIASSRRTPEDRFFTFGLRYQFRPTTDFYAMLDLEIAERAGAVGDSIHQLDARSRYALALRELSPDDAWLAFAVDSTSVDVFRRAREMAIAQGFATGFDLLTFDFPLRVALSEDGMDDLLSPLASLSKPQR
jgi:hypothetical protein